VERPIRTRGSSNSALRVKKRGPTSPGTRRPQEDRMERFPDYRRPEGTPEWIVTGSDEHGLPTGPDNDILLSMLEASRRQGSKRRISRFTTPTGSSSRSHTPADRITRDSFEPYQDGRHFRSTPSTVSTTRTRAVRTQTGFNLFQEYDVISREQRAKGSTPAGKRPPVIFGHVTMTDRFYKMVRENLKDLDLKFYKALSSAPSPTLTKKLYRYLDKKRWYGGYFGMDVLKLCRKLGFDTEALLTYMPAKIRGMLTPSLEHLRRENFFVLSHSRRHLKARSSSCTSQYPAQEAKRKSPSDSMRSSSLTRRFSLKTSQRFSARTKRTRASISRPHARQFVTEQSTQLFECAYQKRNLQTTKAGSRPTKSQYFTGCLEEKTRQFNLPFHQNPPQQAGSNTLTPSCFILQF